MSDADLGPALAELGYLIRNALAERHWYFWDGDSHNRAALHAVIRALIAAIRVLREKQNTPRRIVAAAIRVDGEVWTLPAPARHCHIMHAWCSAHWANGKNAHIPRGHLQGFVDGDGSFVGRVEGARIAIEAGQIEELDHPPNLYSEDLW